MTSSGILNTGRSNQHIIVISLLIVDVLAVALSFILSFYIRKFLPILPPLAHDLDLYLNAWPALVIWPFMFWREGLYPGFWLSVREELRRTVTGTTLASLVAIAATFVTQTGPQFSRPIIVGGWLISIILVPASRFLVRKMITNAGYGGPRAVILGAGKTAEVILTGLRAQRPPALNAVAVFDDDSSKFGIELMGVKVEGPVQEASRWATDYGIRVAIIAMPGVPRDDLIRLVEAQSKVFQRILVIPDLFGISAADTESHEISGILALELRKNLLYRRNRIAKRIIDLLVLLLTSFLVIPISIFIAIVIKLESRGPVLFKHERIGRHGLSFTAWKYRTMVRDSDKLLEETLRNDPELRKEWKVNRKLKNDPRLTRVGKILRRLSLDELPQLWNMLKGEMSLVGPRPIVEKEIEKYGDDFDLYIQVLPGLTGLWQVSGRSDLSYQERVWLDTHYVRNWSIWLDLVILVRTVWVVIAGSGAY